MNNEQDRDNVDEVNLSDAILGIVGTILVISSLLIAPNWTRHFMIGWFLMKIANTDNDGK